MPRAYYNEIDPFAAAWLPARVGRLRGYGNAINAEQAALFAEVMLELV